MRAKISSKGQIVIQRTPRKICYCPWGYGLNLRDVMANPDFPLCKDAIQAGRGFFSKGEPPDRSSF